MSSETQHIDQAEHNLHFLENFYKTHSFNDWSITVSFYSAVHIVENAVYVCEDVKYKNQKITILHSDQLPRIVKQEGIALPENYSLDSASPHVSDGLKVYQYRRDTVYQSLS